jgi:hypothetical protein
MDAVVSGRARVAIIVEGDQLWSIHPEDPREQVPRGPAEWRHLIGDARDLEFIEDIDSDALVRRLDLACDADDALHLALILLDAEEPEEIRSEAAGELEELFGSEEIVQLLERNLYGALLPADADLAGAFLAADLRRPIEINLPTSMRPQGPDRN